MIDQAHCDLLLELNTDSKEHSHGTLLTHLKGTHNLLEEWGNPKHICVAGLFHSIYGTQYYKTQSASAVERQHIAAVIGSDAEEIAFLFCTTDRQRFFPEAINSRPSLTFRDTKQSLSISHSTLSALIEIEIANLLEQARRAHIPFIADAKIKYMRNTMLYGAGKFMTVRARADFTRFIEKCESLPKTLAHQ